MACNCVDNNGYIEAAREEGRAIVTQAQMDVAISSALALWQRNASTSIAGMQEEIANRRTRLAEAVADHAQKFWPYEKDLVNDTFSEAKHHPNYSGLALPYQILTKDALRQGEKDWQRQLDRMCLPTSKCEKARWKSLAANAEADAISFGDRQAEARAEMLNDRRFSRQYTVLGLSRNILSDARTLEEVSAVPGKSAAEILTGSINSALEAYGYFTGRRQQDHWGQAAATEISRAPYDVISRTAPVVDDGPSGSVYSKEFIEWYERNRNGV